MDSRLPRNGFSGSRTGRARSGLAGALGLSLALLLVQGFMASGADASPRRSCLSNVHASRSSEGVNRELMESLWAWKQGNLAKAERCAKRVARYSHDDEHRTIAYSVLCGLYRDAGQAEVSLQYCNRAVERDRGRVWQHLANRAHTYLIMGRPQEATLDFDAAIVLLIPRAEQPSRRAEPAREALERLREHRPSAQQRSERGEEVAQR